MTSKEIAEMAVQVDRKDPERITWCEFIEWLEAEGLKREKMHDAGLHQSGKTRIPGDGVTYKLSKSRMEYKIDHMLPIQVTDEMNVLLVIFENDVAQFMDLTTMKPICDLKIKDKFFIKEKVD